MINEQILKKAIDKVIANGWNPIDDMGKVYEFVIHRAGCHWKAIWIKFYTEAGDGGQLDLTRLIFDHDFAKAFWGEKIAAWKALEAPLSWKWNLQQMVLEPEPLKYLEKFL